MTKRMLIDTSHPEETRVAVISGNRLEDFDFESASRKQLKGNIYLAKVTRVEPSLQAAFIEYGGNRHGFLPFSEIHPDYYRIPIADREALLAAEADTHVETVESESSDDEDGDDDSNAAAPEAAGDDETSDDETSDDEALAAEAPESEDPDVEARAEAAIGGNGAVEELEVEPKVDTLENDDVEDAARKRAKLMRRYKIQEVIKRRQVLLIQVTKEERGNKGAALTTYLSLAGRYCVLMPNTAKGGGISRKIAGAKDRRRLKDILESLKIPEGIAVILRTAGSERTKAEIRRDYDFLLRLWDEIRSTTLASTAPALVYEEANLIKRAIRDVYQSDTDEILVEGDEGYKAAKAFMKSLTPSHARKVKQYKDPTVPLFYRHQIESQIDAMHNPVVQLRSGGYIVIHMTEALVAIDVNSGKATRERHIEETAYKTNLEAAEEVARQLRLRDMAGLIVIDFIDMEESRHNRTVERKLKDAMRRDRARIQLGRISPFGLLELSRQRLRPSLLESSTEACRYCSASGYVRTTQSVALHVLRALEEEGIRRGGGSVTAGAPRDAAHHLLNQMRDRLVGIEQRYGLQVAIIADDTLIPPNFTLQRSSVAGSEAAVVERPRVEADSEEEDRGERKRGRGRRRRKRPSEGEDAAESMEAADTDQGAPAETSGGEAAEVSATEDASEDSGGEKPRRRRRGKRGGRRRTRRSAEDGTETRVEGEGNESPEDAQAGAEATDASAAEPETRGPDEAETPAEDAKPSRSRRRRSPRRPRSAAPAEAEAQPETPPNAPTVTEEEAESAGQTGSVTTLERPETEAEAKPVSISAADASGSTHSETAEDDAADEAEPKRRGWWNRWS